MNRDARQILTELMVLRAQAGEERAFEDLYRLWNPALRGTAAVQLEHGHAVDEVTQDAWVTIARGLGRLLDPACFPRWAFRILHRRCADWIRGRQKERRHVEPLPAMEDAHALSIPAEAETTASGSDGVAALAEAIARLDPNSRKLLRLFYELGFTIPEIAEILDIAPGTVKSRLFTLRETLKTTTERQYS